LTTILNRHRGRRPVTLAAEMSDRRRGTVDDVPHEFAATWKADDVVALRD